MPINLALFTSTERPPFFLDGYTYATDGRIVLRIPGRYQDTPDWSQVSVTEGNIWKPQGRIIKTIRTLFLDPPLPLKHSVAECFKPSAVTVCPACNGDSQTPFHVFEVKAKLGFHVITTNEDTALAITRHWFENAFDRASADNIAYDATRLKPEERRLGSALTAEMDWAEIGPDDTFCPACRGLGKHVPLLPRSIDNVPISQLYLARIASLDGARISPPRPDNDGTDHGKAFWFSADYPKGMILGRLADHKGPATSDWREP